MTDVETLPAVDGRPLLDGMTVVLTGAAGGIGQTITHVLASAGARLALVDLAPEPLEELREAVPDGRDRVLVRALDAADFAAIRGLAEEVERELGPVDGLVNCAGAWAARPYDEIEPAEWARMLAANLTTAFAGCQAVVPAMVARGGGSIVNFASTAGEYGSISPAVHYAAAKGGVIALTKSLAREVSPHGVRVNAISPGPIDTPALGAATPEQKTEVGARTLFGRLGTPAEIAYGCVFLLSDLSTFVTGHVLGVNGGSRL